MNGFPHLPEYVSSAADYRRERTVLVRRRRPPADRMPLLQRVLSAVQQRRAVRHLPAAR